MIAVGDPRAVIRGKQDEGVGGDLGGVEGLEDFADRPIEFHHNIAIQAGTRFILELVAAEERHVRHRMGQVKEERPVAVAMNEIDGAFGVPGGELGLVLGRDAVDGDFAVDPVLERELAPIAGVFGMMFPHIVGDHESAGFAETACWRACIRLIADVPFSEGSGGVAMRVEDFGERGELWIESASIGRVCAKDLGTPGITAGEKRGAGSGADGLGHIEIVESRAFIGEALDVGSGVRGLGEWLEVGPTGVVEENDNEVGRALRILCLSGRAARAEYSDKSEQ